MSDPRVDDQNTRLLAAMGTRDEAFAPYYSRIVSHPSPSVTNNPIGMGPIYAPSEIIKVSGFVEGGTSVALDVRYGTDISATGTEVVVGGITITNSTHQDFSPLYNTLLATNDILWVEWTTVTGTVNSVCVAVLLRYRTDL